MSSFKFYYAKVNKKRVTSEKNKSNSMVHTDIEQLSYPRFGDIVVFL